MHNVAVLDAAGMLVGYKRVEVLSLSDIEVSEKDLEPYKYVWDFELKRFLPIATGPAVPRGRGKPPVDHIIALGGLVQALSDQGIILPRETLDWLAWVKENLSKSHKRGWWNI